MRGRMGAPTSMRVLGRHAKKVQPDDREGVILVGRRIIVIFTGRWSGLALSVGGLIGVIGRRAGSAGIGRYGLKRMEYRGPWLERG